MLPGPDLLRTIACFEARGARARAWRGLSCSFWHQIVFIEVIHREEASALRPNVSSASVGNVSRHGRAPRGVKPPQKWESLKQVSFKHYRCIHISKVLCTLLLWTMIGQRFRSRGLWGAPSAGACGVGDYPTPDLSRSESEGRSASEKRK